jgi:hypothetical protein
MKTSSKGRRVLEITINIAIIVVAIIVVRNLVVTRWQPKAELARPKIGANVVLPGVRWDHATTLVLVLQKECRYCEASAAFYQTLRQVKLPGQRMLAVIPGETSDTTRYLEEHGVVVDQVVNASLAELGVVFTPTLLLVDETGNVKEAWPGQLDAGKEAQVVKRLTSSL